VEDEGWWGDLEVGFLMNSVECDFFRPCIYVIHIEIGYVVMSIPCTSYCSGKFASLNYFHHRSTFR
jgi:hypothetical protein